MDQQDKTFIKNDYKKQMVRIAFNLWWLVAVLMVIIVGMLLMWRPWVIKNDSRTVAVSGTTTTKAVPDQYTFSPSWEFKDADKSIALKNATEKSDEIVGGLKKLNIADSNIKTNVGGWDGWYYFNEEQKQYTYTLNITVDVSDLKLAQKVQDYLVSVAPTGQVTPNVGFSEAKRKSLESDARSAATKDARAKADQMAQNLGFKVGAVKSITDDSNNGAYPMAARAEPMSGGDAAKTLSVQPGENELTYTVQVVYYIR